MTLSVTLSQLDVSGGQERSGQTVIRWVSGARGRRGYDRRVSYDVTAHISDLSLKPHKQDGSVLETGRPKVSNI